MKTYVRFLFLANFLAVFAAPAFGGGPPPTGGVCDELLADGVTSALFPLCRTYCETLDCDSYPAGEEPAMCGSVLANYNKKATGPEDSDMPCLAPAEPSCPCWTAAEFENRGGGLPVGLCLLGFPVFVGVPPEQEQVGVQDLATYTNAPGGTDEILFSLVTYIAGGGDCAYKNTIDLPNAEPTPDHTRIVLDIGDDEVDACYADILDLTDDWLPLGGVDCIVFP